MFCFLLGRLVRVDVEVCLPSLVIGIHALLATSSLQYECQFMLFVNCIARLLGLFRLTISLCLQVDTYIGMVDFDYFLTF